MLQISMKSLMQAGAHFGHQTQRWNPKMKRFIFGSRNGIHIIDLQQTVELARTAGEFIRTVTAKGKKVLFVGTKKQAQEVIKESAARCQMPYVIERWLGGLLTNFETVTSSMNRMKEIEEWKENGTLESLGKKEQSKLTKEHAKLNANLGGIREMGELPGALFVVDPHLEHIAITEANKLGIPTVAIVDTNCDPDVIRFQVPGNDDAVRSIKLFSDFFADCCLEGMKDYEMTARASADSEPKREPKGKSKGKAKNSEGSEGAGS